MPSAEALATGILCARWERERERERDTDRQTDRQTETECQRERDGRHVTIDFFHITW